VGALVDRLALLSSGFSVDVEMDLIELYHQGLVDNDVQGYTFRQCLEDYKRSMFNQQALTSLDSSERLVSLQYVVTKLN
jgi:hypothetical protein